jgi:hypothetical protein
LHTNHYDVVVCGTELGGLVAAALLGRRGYRVLLCGHDAHPGTINAAGYMLAAAPGVLPPIDTEPVARVLRELNHVQIIRRRAAPVFPGVQVRLPRQSFELHADELATTKALERAFPGQGDRLNLMLVRLAEVSALLDPLLGADVTLPPTGFWERREVARVEARLRAALLDPLASLPTDHPLRLAAAALTLLDGRFGPGDAGAVAQARAVTVASQGVYRLDGGMPALRALFREKLQTYSGEVREKVVPAELRWRRGRVSGLRFFPRDEVVGLGELVWAGSPGPLLALAGEHAGRRLRETASGVRPACYRYCLCLLVEPGALPPALGPRLISVQDPGRPLMEHNLLGISVGAPARGELEAVPLWVECLVPAAALTSGIGYLGLVRARVREHLHEALPELARYLLVMASPHDGLPPELPEGRPGPGRPLPIPAAPLPALLSSDLPRALEVGAAPHGTGIPNVHLCSGDNLPGLGREGDFASAYGLVRLLAGSAATKPSRKKEIVILDG